MALLKAGRPTGRTQEHVQKQAGQMDEKVRLNVQMSKAVYMKLKQFALDHDMSISDVVKKALDEHMSK